MRAPRVEIRFAGDQLGFARAFSRLHAALDYEQLERVPRYGVELVFEEIVSNIIKYGAVDGRALDIGVLLEVSANEIAMTFDDDGMPFDPTAKTAPQPAKSLDEEKVGGHGLTLVRKTASSISYRRTKEGRNLLAVAVPRAT